MMIKEIKFIIEEFEIGSINAFECIRLIKKKIKSRPYYE